MFVIASTERAKRVARDLRNELKCIGVGLDWSQALETVARMYGYANWAGLLNHTKGKTASPDDDACSAAEAEARLHQQLAAVTALGVSEVDAKRVVQKIRPTSRSRRKTEEDLPPSLRYIAAKARAAASDRKWDEASEYATAGLQEAAGPLKEPFAALLREIAEHSVWAASNLAMAYLTGDAGRVDAARAKLLLEKASGMTSDSQVLAFAHAVLGDIASGGHGMPPNIPDALDHWETAAAFGSGDAAFNAGLTYRESGQLFDAARCFELGEEAGHAHSMTNLAGLILMGALPESPDRMEELYRRAASLGDSIAAEALPHMAALREAAESARSAMRDTEANFEHGIRTVAGYVPELWFQILRELGWTLSDLRPDATGEGAQVCVASDANGREFPVFMSAASYMRGDEDDALVQKLQRQLQSHPDAVLVFNASGMLCIGGQEAAAICGGRICRDGSWTDFFLKEGGLDEALRQHLILLENGALDVVDSFSTPRAMEIAERVGMARYQALDSLLGEDI